MVSSLEADRDEVSPVGPNEVKRVSDVNGYTQSLGGMETPGFLVVPRIPDVIVPECVEMCAEYECHGVRECMRRIGTRTDPDGGRVKRAEWAASKYFGNRAGFTGRRVRCPSCI